MIGLLHMDGQLVEKGNQNLLVFFNATNSSKYCHVAYFCVKKVKGRVLPPAVIICTELVRNDINIFLQEIDLPIVD